MADNADPTQFDPMAHCVLHGGSVPTAPGTTASPLD